MKSNTTLVMGEAMPISRRALIAAVPAVAASAVVPAMAGSAQTHMGAAATAASALVVAMAHPEFEGMSVTVRGADAKQPIFFKADDTADHLPSDWMVALIEAHRDALAAFEASCNAADTMHPEYGGAPAEQLWARNSDIEAKALGALLACQTCSLADQRARAAHLLTIDLDALMDRGGIEALLRSLATIS